MTRNVKLLCDQTDLRHATKLGDNRLRWLQQLGATELADAALDEPGFLFSYGARNGGPETVAGTVICQRMTC